MGFQLVPRSNSRIALGVVTPPKGTPYLQMVPQGTSPIDQVLWDIRVMYWGGDGTPCSILGTSIIHRQTRLPLRWHGYDQGVELGTDPEDYGDSFHSWIFGPKVGESYCSVTSADTRFSNYSLQLDSKNNICVRAASAGDAGYWWFIPYDDGGSASTPIGLMSSWDGKVMRGYADGGVYMIGLSTEQAVTPDFQWEFVTRLVDQVPQNTQLIRNVAYKSYLHASGIGPGLNLVPTVPPDHESINPSLWLPGRTPVDAGFSIPNPCYSNAVVTTGTGRDNGVYLKDWASNTNNQLWTFTTFTVPSKG